MDPRILPNSERFLLLKKNWQYNELTNYLLARLKHYKDHLVCILKTIFACKSFICVRLFVFFMLQTALMSRIDLVSKNLLANCFRNFSKKRFKENCYQKNREEIANVTNIAKVRRIFLATWEDWVTNMAKIMGITNFSKFYFYKEKRPRRASWKPQISQKSQK